MSQSTSSSNGSKTPLLSDAWYTILKHSAAIALPALAALYYALSQIWHFPDTAQVMATIAAINTAVGALVGVSTISYNTSGSKYVGALEVMDDAANNKKTYSLAFNSDPIDLDQKSEVTFKVTPIPSPPPPPNITAHGASIG